MRLVSTVCALAAVLAGAACDRGGSAGGGEAAENLAAAEAFLEEKAAEEGVQQLESGVYYEVVREGPEGAGDPRPGDTFKLHYEGKFLDGEVFDSSFERGVPMVWEPHQTMIPGFEAAVEAMQPGDEWIVYIHPDMAYGAGRPGMPPNALLTFRIELIDFLPAPGRSA